MPWVQARCSALWRAHLWTPGLINCRAASTQNKAHRQAAARTQKATSAATQEGTFRFQPAVSGRAGGSSENSSSRWEPPVSTPRKPLKSETKKNRWEGRGARVAVKLETRIARFKETDTQGYGRRGHEYTRKRVVGVDNRDSHRYNSGRWLLNEKQRLLARDKKISLKKLVARAAEATNDDPAKVFAIRKIVEDDQNRVFRLTWTAGHQIIMRLAYPFSGPEPLAVNSEVATMDLARRHGIPVPKVLAYHDRSCRDSEGVGLPYMVMDAVQGTCLAELWATMPMKKKERMMAQIAEIEAKLAAIELPAYGNIFYPQDLDSSYQRTPFQFSPPGAPESVAFCLGPEVSTASQETLQIEQPQYYEHHSTFVRHVLQYAAEDKIRRHQKDKGPDLKVAPVARQYNAIEDHPKASPSEYADLLTLYTQVARYLEPRDTASSRPTLRHGNLCPENIIVSDDLKIIAVLNWRYSTVLPQFLQGFHPPCFQASTLPSTPPTDTTFQHYFDKLITPEIIDSVGKEMKAEGMVEKAYRTAVAKANPRLHASMVSERDTFLRKLHYLIKKPWDGNLVPLRAALMHLTQNWSKLVDHEEAPASCPISFEQEDIDRTMHLLAEQEEVDRKVDVLRRSLGLRSDGWVSEEAYEATKEKNNVLLQQATSAATTEDEKTFIRRSWPFAHPT